jgi:ankyrin repeat protein
MDNSPPRLPPSGLNLPEQQHSFPQDPPGRLAQRIQRRGQPFMQQLQDECSSDEDVVDTLWVVKTKPVSLEWLNRLSPLSRLCYEAGGLLATQGAADMMVQAKSLLDAGANVHEPDPVTGRTPLHWVCYGGCVELLRLLCAAVTDDEFDHTDSKGETAMCTAIHSPLLENPAPFIECLLVEGAELDKLPRRGKELLQVDWLTIPIAVRLVGAGINIDTQDRFRETPLLRACNGKQLPLAQYLLQQGADPNRCGLFRRTILHIGNLDEQAAFLLIQNGAKPDEPDEMGMTPLMYALNCENVPLVRLLVLHGASLYKRSLDGMSVLEHARQAGDHLYYFIIQKMGLLPDTKPASG